MSDTAAPEGTTAPPAPPAPAPAAVHVRPASEQARLSEAARALASARIARAAPQAPPASPPQSAVAPASAGQPDPGPPGDTGDPPTAPEPPPGEVDPQEDAPAPALEPSTVLWTRDDGTPVTLEEARRSDFRQADYTRKTQATAQHEDLLAQGAEALHRQLQRVQAGSYMAEPPRPPDPALQQSDPLGYLTAAALYQQQRWAYEEQGNDQRRAEEAEQAARQRRYAEWLEAEHRKALEIIPSWRDEKTATREKGEIARYAAKVGFSQEEIARLDHRQVRVLRDAAIGASRQPPTAAKPAPAPSATAATGRVTGELAGSERARGQQRAADRTQPASPRDRMAYAAQVGWRKP